MPEPQTPLIRQSPLSGRWFVVTRYRVYGNATNPKFSNIEAIEKFDVTDQIAAILKFARKE